MSNLEKGIQFIEKYDVEDAYTSGILLRFAFYLDQEANASEKECQHEIARVNNDMFCSKCGRDYVNIRKEANASESTEKEKCCIKCDKPFITLRYTNQLPPPNKVWCVDCLCHQPKTSSEELVSVAGKDTPILPQKPKECECVCHKPEPIYSNHLGLSCYCVKPNKRMKRIEYLLFTGGGIVAEVVAKINELINSYNNE